jgi:hypothetical protein
MSSKKILTPLAVLAALGPLAAGTARPDLRKLFPKQAQVTIARAGLVGLELSPEVVAQCQSDLSDVRLLDPKGREIAFAITSGAPPDTRRRVAQSVKVPIAKLQRELNRSYDEEPSYQEVFDLEAVKVPPQGDRFELVFQTSASEFVRRVKVEEKTRDGSYETLISDGAIYRVPGAERLSIAHAALGRNPVRVTLSGPDRYLNPTLVFASGQTLAEREPSLVPLEVLGRRQDTGRTVVDLARPRGLVLDAVRIKTTSQAFRRPVEIWDAGNGTKGRLLGQATLVRIVGVAQVEQLEARLEQAQGDRLRIEIANEESPELEELQFLAVVRRPMLVFATNKSGATLFFGGARACAPHYDLAALVEDESGVVKDRAATAALALTDIKNLKPARLGPIADNPLFEDTPLLAFVMRPGVAVDRRPYSHLQRLTLQPSSEGLSRVRLDAGVQAASQADLADVRIVDSSSRQWPYLLDRDATSELLAAPLREESHLKGESHYRLQLPASPLRLNEVIFDVNAAFFNRAYTLMATLDSGSDSVLAEGRLVRKLERGKAESSGPSVAIEISPQRIKSLELAVHDGDDAPLSISQFRVRTLVSLALVTAPQGEYTLLVGKPDESAPQYELNEVRDLVEAVGSGIASGNSVEVNPAYSIRARMEQGSGPTQVALWSVLGLAVLLLGGLTLRLAKRPD